MEQRTTERFRKRSILVHWLHAASSTVLLITGGIMLFDLTTMGGGQTIRTVHQITAIFFVGIPLLFLLFDPRAALRFLKEAFHWDRDDRSWLKASLKYYFGRQVEMPPQGYINGDQKLWQLIVIVTGLIFALSGAAMWFFKLKMAWIVYQGFLLTHMLAFIVLALVALIHFYLVTLHPKFAESLSSMVDGKISSTYAREHYGKWYVESSGKSSAEPPKTLIAEAPNDQPVTK